jgi:hypothetical protein
VPQRTTQLSRNRLTICQPFFSDEISLSSTESPGNRAKSIYISVIVNNNARLGL